MHHNNPRIEVLLGSFRGLYAAREANDERLPALIQSEARVNRRIVRKAGRSTANEKGINGLSDQLERIKRDMLEVHEERARLTGELMEVAEQLPEELDPRYYLP